MGPGNVVWTTCNVLLCGKCDVSNVCNVIYIWGWLCLQPKEHRLTLWETIWWVPWHTLACTDTHTNTHWNKPSEANTRPMYTPILRHTHNEHATQTINTCWWCTRHIFGTWSNKSYYIDHSVVQILLNVSQSYIYSYIYCDNSLAKHCSYWLISNIMCIWFNPLFSYNCFISVL